MQPIHSSETQTVEAEQNTGQKLHILLSILNQTCLENIQFLEQQFKNIQTRFKDYSKLNPNNIHNIRRIKEALYTVNQDLQHCKTVILQPNNIDYRAVQKRNKRNAIELARICKKFEGQKLGVHSIRHALKDGFDINTKELKREIQRHNTKKRDDNLIRGQPNQNLKHILRVVKRNILNQIAFFSSQCAKIHKKLDVNNKADRGFIHKRIHKASYDKACLMSPADTLLNFDYQNLRREYRQQAQEVIVVCTKLQLSKIEQNLESYFQISVDKKIEEPFQKAKVSPSYLASDHHSAIFFKPSKHPPAYKAKGHRSISAGYKSFS